jgi:hypothetical protein
MMMVPSRHPEPLQRHQESLLRQAILPPVPQHRSFFCHAAKIGGALLRDMTSLPAAVLMIGTLYWIKQ